MAKKNKKSICDWPFFRIILTIASTVLSIAILMLSAFTVINIYNNDYEVYMKINLYEQDIEVPGQELYGSLPGFLGKKHNSFCWVITSAKVKGKTATITLINDFLESIPKEEAEEKAAEQGQ